MKAAPAPGTPAIRSLLVVDDSAVQLARIVQMCRAIGVSEVHDAGHGADALKQLERMALGDELHGWRKLHAQRLPQLRPAGRKAPAAVPRRTRAPFSKAKSI